MDRSGKHKAWMFFVDTVLGGVLVALMTALVLGLVAVYWIEG